MENEKNQLRENQGFPLKPFSSVAEGDLGEQRGPPKQKKKNSSYKPVQEKKTEKKHMSEEQHKILCDRLAKAREKGLEIRRQKMMAKIPQSPPPAPCSKVYPYTGQGTLCAPEPQPAPQPREGVHFAIERPIERPQIIAPDIRKKKRRGRKIILLDSDDSEEDSDEDIIKVFTGKRKQRQQPQQPQPQPQPQPEPEPQAQPKPDDRLFNPLELNLLRQQYNEQINKYKMEQLLNNLPKSTWKK